MADAKLLRDAQIKTGVLKRYIKEFHYYRAELQKNTEKIKAMKEDPNVDEYAVKKFSELVQESRSLVPLAAANVKKACEALKQLIEANEDALQTTEHLKNAQEQINAATDVE